MGEQHINNDSGQVGPDDYEFDTILLTADALNREAQRKRDQKAAATDADTVEQSASGEDSLERSSFTKGFGRGPHDRTADWNHL